MLCLHFYFMIVVSLKNEILWIGCFVNYFFIEMPVSILCYGISMLTIFCNNFFKQLAGIILCRFYVYHFIWSFLVFYITQLLYSYFIYVLFLKHKCVSNDSCVLYFSSQCLACQTSVVYCISISQANVLRVLCSSW